MLHFDADTCFPLRHRAGGCEACAQACPRGAIAFDASGLQVADTCTGCGRCAVACPMGALGAAGFDDGVAGAPAAASLECRRVPPRARVPDAAVVPCLGGVDVASLIARQRACGSGPQLIDRGWCADCPSGGGATHPAAEAVGRAGDLLEAMGVVRARQPRIVAMPLPADVKPQPLADAQASQPPSRRAFFARLSQCGGQVLADVAGLAGRAGAAADDGDGRLARAARPSRARVRLLAACVESSHAYRLPMPFGLFRAAAVDARCCDRGLCVSVCPTAALLRTTDDGAAALVFAAVRCIDCGACVRACPEGALRLDVRGDEGWRAPEVLARFERRTCNACGETFTAHGDERECEPCTKSRTLMHDAFRQLFGVPPRDAPATRCAETSAAPPAVDRFGPYHPEEESR
jgi:Fe-S-cluster-containing hydrogenase component 2